MGKFCAGQTGRETSDVEMYKAGKLCPKVRRLSRKRELNPVQKAYIISTGTELMLGSTVDTNSVFLSRHLTALGFKVVGKNTVGDSEQYIREAFRQGMQTADLVVSSGGLGPTRDDLTREAVCRELGLELLLRKDEAENLKEFFRKRHREMPEANFKQVMFPVGAKALKNVVGTAPGMYLEHAGKTLILLPGPPREMEKMFLEQVMPILKTKYDLVDRVVRKTIKILGPGESQVEAILGNIGEQYRGLSMALLARDGEVHVKISAEGENREHTCRMVDDAAARIGKLLGGHIFAYDEETLEQSLSNLLKARGRKLAVAESCTGGLLSKMLTDIPGSSAYFWGAACTYSNEAKKKILGVPGDILEKHGAVSPETALAMARGVRNLSGADFSLSTTGIAGPDGGNEKKPVGLVYIGLVGAEIEQVKELRFVGGREAIRILSAKSAMDLLRRHLIEGGARP